MDRARRAGLTALIVVVLVAVTSGPAGLPALAAAVGWSTSTLVLSEIQTGGASASDEFVEIANQGATPVDLVGLELVYATASGSTVTRRATWDASTILAPGRRLLLANAGGIYAAVADTAYSGGFAATGGALALRTVGGSVVDSVGWGDVANDFVEGNPAGAPPASMSLERMPGGMGGNAIDTNDNASDWFVPGSPSPQGLSSPAVPAPSPTPSPSPYPTPGTGPIPTPTPTPTPASSPPPMPTSTPIPAATLMPIASARSLPDGTTVSVEGVLTTELGSVESGRGGFVQDASGGIAVYLDAMVVGSWPAGTTVVIRGSISSRFAQRTIRLAEASIERGILGSVPAAISVATGDAGEPLEGTRLTVVGTVSGSLDTLADGIGITLDDGSGPIRAVIGMDALADQGMASGVTATVSGPLGQRDSSGTGSAGYRIHATLDGELLVAEPTPTPTPEASPTPSLDATPTPEASPDPTPTSPASPAYGGAETLAAVRAMAIGARVTISAVVTAEMGRLGTPELIAVGDDTGGIAVRMPSGVEGSPRGTRLQISGTLAAPYGQLEIRAAKDGVRATGVGSVPIAIAAGTGDLDETVEGRLVTVTGSITTKPTRSSGGDLTIVIERPGAAPIKVSADASSRLTSDTFSVGATYRLVGIVGQRATRKGALDGYRICLRDLGDVVALADAGIPAGAVSAGSPRPTASAGDAPSTAIQIARALGLVDQAVAIEGIVTAPATLLDATGRRIVVQDGSAAIELLLPTDVDAPRVGTRIRAEGRIGLAYGAPRLRAEQLTILGSGLLPPPVTLRGAPGLPQEWRLVTVTGRIDDVRKLGDRWRAELLVAGNRVVVVGQPGFGIAVTTLVEGRMAIVIGIVRRAYPTASDQRYAITPRTPADLRIVGAHARSAGQGTVSAAHPVGSAAESGAVGEQSQAGTVDADLVDLVALSGRIVRVGGLIVDLRPDGMLLDDGTAVGLVVVRGAALALLPLLEPDDAINATGHVERLADGPAVVVDDPGGIVQAGDPIAPATGSSDAGPTRLESALPSTQHAGFLDGPPGIGAGLAGLGTLVILSLASLAVTLGRRAHARRRLEAEVAARLAAFGASASPPPSPRSAERDANTFDSA